MITISKHFQFDAAHHLPTMPEGHMCRRMHGHTYKAELILNWFDTSFPWREGFAVDYGVLDTIWKDEVDCLVNHRVLNEIMGLEVPTTEVLARWIFNRLDDVIAKLNGDHCLRAVRVYESTTTWCEYIYESTTTWCEYKPDAYA